MKTAAPNVQTNPEPDVQSSESAWKLASQLEGAKAVLGPSSSGQTQAPPPSQQPENSPSSLLRLLQLVVAVFWETLYAMYKDPVLRLTGILCFVYPTVYQVIKLHAAITMIFLFLLRLFSLVMQCMENRRASLSGEIPLRVDAFIFLSTAVGLCLGILAESNPDDSVFSCWLLHVVWSEVFLLNLYVEIRALWFPASRGWKTLLDVD